MQTKTNLWTKDFIILSLVNFFLTLIFFFINIVTLFKNDIYLLGLILATFIKYIFLKTTLY